MSVPILDSTHAPTAPTHVMISSVMRDRESDREAVARVIEELGDIPWYADKPLHEFSNISGETLSFRMAEDCDLYLLIIFPRYGTVFDGDPRSVTHQEFDRARKVNPYKVEVFIAAEAKANPESDALRNFMSEVSNFREGYSPHIFTSVTDLQKQVRTALGIWRDGGNTGRNAYVRAVANEYSAFRNPVTGKEMDYGDAVQVNLRARTQPDVKRAEWGKGGGEGDDSDEGSKKRDRQQNREERERKWENERNVTAIQPPPQVLRELLAKYMRVVVIGDVGTGKSTLLKQMLHDAAHDYFQTMKGRLPILVTATQLGRAAIKNSAQPLAVVVGQIQQDDTRYDALRQTVNRTVSEALYKGDALLLIDGLDEANASEQSAVFELLGDIGKNSAVLASRPSAYNNQLTGWQIADLQQLEPEQRNELVHKVFHIETYGSDQPDGDDGTLLELAERMLADLSERETDLAVWAGNPLLLTLIAVQYLRDQRLPENRARVYEFALEDLQRQRPATARRALTERELETYLRLLALRMTRALRRDTTISEVRDTYLPEYALRNEVISEILERSGVLQRDVAATTSGDDSSPMDGGEKARYEFVHISFREYLAACNLADMPKRELHRLVRRHCLHQAWEQVLILLVNRLDLIERSGKADQVIRALMHADDQRIAVFRGADPTHLALRVATRCALSRGNRASDGLIRELGTAWWPIWRAEERRLLTASEFTLFVNEKNLESDLNIDVSVDYVPQPLREAVPIVLDKVYKRWQFPTSTWWLTGLLITLSALGILFVTTQITLTIGPIAHSGWGHTISGIVPYVLLTLLCVVALLRIYGLFAARSVIQIAMLYRTYYQTYFSDDASHQASQSLKQFGEHISAAPLLAMLHGEDHLMLAAARTLEQLGERTPVAPLVAMLRKRRSNWLERQAAAEVLGHLGERAPVEPLVAALLHDPDPSVRLDSAQALGELGERAPVEPLVAALHDEDASVQQAALQALGQLGQIEPLLGALHDTVMSTRDVAAEMLSQLIRKDEHAPNERLLAALQVALQDADEQVRQAAMQVLEAFGARAPTEPLLKALQDTDGFVRSEALTLLGERAPVDSLLVALHDPYVSVRAAATQTLGRLGDHAPIESVLAMLHDANEEVRETALQVLKEFIQQGAEIPVEPLVAALSDENASVREAAAQSLWTLAESGQEGAQIPVEPLVAALSDANSDVRRMARDALVFLHLRLPLDPILALLHHPDGDVREAALHVLRQFGEQVPIEPVLALSHDAHWGVRREAVGVLGQLGERAPIAALVAALYDDEGTVRQAAMEALKQLSEQIPAESMLALLRDKDSWVRLTALVVLVQRGEQIPVELLVDMLRDEIWSTRQAALHALSELAQQDVSIPVEPLVADLHSTNKDVRETAVAMLAQLGEHALVEPFFAALHDDDALVREAAVVTLGQVGEHAPIDRIVAALKDKEAMVRLAALLALDELGASAPIESLMRALEDANTEVRKAAIQTLVSRSLSPQDMRKLYRVAMHPKGSWIDDPMRLVHWLTDWPMLVAVLLAQGALIFPAISARLPLPGPVHWLFGLTSWWQALIIFLLYATCYLGASYLRARIVYSDYQYDGSDRQRIRVEVLDTLESVIRRQVADTDSKTLADNSD